MLQEIVDYFQEFGLIGIFIHAFFDAVIFPIPAFFLQVSLSIMDPSAALWIATVGYIGCLLGTPFGYLIGKLLGNKVIYKILKRKWVESGSALFEKNGDVAILIGSFTPIPFKVFTILSGCLNFSLWKLIGYAAIGRAAKFYVVGVLFYFYGRAAEGMVNGYLTYILLGVAIIIFVIVLLIKKKKSSQQQEDVYGTTRNEMEL